MKKLMLLMAIVAVLTVTSVSAIIPTYVTGNVYWSDGVTPVEGASVEVNCNGFLRNDVTDAGGNYDVEYSAIECSSGDAVSVTATKDDAEGTNDGDVMCHSQECPFDIAIVDVQIPEFGVVAAGLALVGAIAGFAVLRRRD